MQIVDRDTPTDRVELSATEKFAMDEASGWVAESMAVLGEAYLEFEEAKLRFELAEKRLRSASATARETEKQRANVVRTVVAKAELPDGSWQYDGAGAMVRKGSKNG